MKTKVSVTLVAETQVEIEVEHGEDEDPTDLTKEDRQRAYRDADPLPTWNVDRVEVV